MKIIREAGNLKANGHYALATVHQGTVYVSGQFSFNPQTGEKQFGTIEEEARQALHNVQTIVEAAGSTKEQIVRMTLYISDIEKWSRVNAVYQEFFGEHTPARTVVPTNDLHFGFQIEVDGIAYI